jgi:hypothetical protein
MFFLHDKMAADRELFMEENKTESTEKPVEKPIDKEADKPIEKPTEKPAEEPKPKKAKRPCCEDDAFDKALVSPKKKRYLIFLSGLSALVSRGGPPRLLLFDLLRRLP